MEVDQDTGIIRPVRARERHLGAGVPAAAASDLYLAAAKVELGAANVAGVVKGDLLDAEEVVAVGQGGGDVDEELGLACKQP